MQQAVVFVLCAFGISLGFGQDVNRAAFSENVYGLEAGQSYYVQVTVGEPLYRAANQPNTFNLLLDTGSSNDAVAGPRSTNVDGIKKFSCDLSSSCVKFSTAVQVVYGSGSIRGGIVTDTFSGPLLKRHDQIPFIEIDSQDSFFQHGFEGILGVAYNSIAQPRGNAPDSFFDTVVKNEKLKNAFGLQLCGIRHPLLQGIAVDGSRPILSGKWLVGGRDNVDGSRLFKGLMYYTPIVQEKWYVVLLSDLSINGVPLGMPCNNYNSPQALLDSGTTNMQLPSNVYRTLMRKLSTEIRRLVPNFPLSMLRDGVVCCEPAVCDPANPNALVLQLPSIEVSFALDGGNTKEQFTVSIPPQFYFRPLLTSTSRRSCRTFGITEGTYAILGNVFMDGLYVYHDRSNKKVGIAVADNCPNNVVSIKAIVGTESKDSWCDCLSQGERDDSLLVGWVPWSRTCFFMAWWMYVVLFSGGVFVLTILFMCFQMCKKKNKHKRPRRKASNNTFADTAMLGYDPAVHAPLPRRVKDDEILGNNTQASNGNDRHVPRGRKNPNFVPVQSPTRGNDTQRGRRNPRARNERPMSSSMNSSFIESNDHRRHHTTSKSYAAPLLDRRH